MNHISDLFSKLKGNFASQAGKKEQVIEVCMDVAKVSLKIDEIEVHPKYIKITTNPSARSVIFMKKAEILSRLADKIKPTPIDIR